MLNTKKSTAGSLTRSRTALALIAATLLVGATSTEASARSRYHGHHHIHHASSDSDEGSKGASKGDWKDANASVAATGGHSFSGVASFYGNESGSQTASGQRFNQNAMTCAHRSLPFGTKLRVTDVASGKSVTVRVNDRGPYVHGRVVDVSYSAADALGMIGKGVAKVKLDAYSHALNNVLADRTG